MTRPARRAPIAGLALLTLLTALPAVLTAQVRGLPGAERPEIAGSGNAGAGAGISASSGPARAWGPGDAGAAIPTGPITLGDAARLAAGQAAPVTVAQLRAAQADARARQDRAALLPTAQAIAAQNGRSFNTATMGIDFPASEGNPPLFDPAGQVVGPVNTTDLRGRVAAPLLDLAALGRYRGARASAGAADVEVASAAELAAGQAAIAYVRLQRAVAQLSARSADSALAADLLGVARDQLAAGVGVRLDVTRAEAQVASTRAQLLGARNERDRAELELRRALDVPLDTPLVLADSLRAPAAAPIPAEDVAVSQALARRPDLKAFDARLAASRQLIDATRAERLPTLSVFVDDGIIGRSVAHMLNTYTWGLQLSVPVFQGFRRAGLVDEQTARMHELEVLRHDLEQQVAADVRGALLDLSSAAEQVDAADERLRLAEQEVEQAGERFRAGISGNADVITASLSLTGARTQLNDALTSYQAARVALARAGGDVTALP